MNVGVESKDLMKNKVREGEGEKKVLFRSPWKPIEDQ